MLSFKYGLLDGINEAFVKVLITVNMNRPTNSVNIDNSNKPFIPKIMEKPNSIEKLEDTMKRKEQINKYFQNYKYSKKTKITTQTIMKVTLLKVIVDENNQPILW